LSEAQRKEAVRGIYDTWEAIGFDVLAAVAEDKGVSAEAVTMPREDVIEVTLDADHVMTYARFEDPDLVKVFKGHGAEFYDLRQELAREAFPCEHYGL
jgi:hypothetical protein